MHYYFRSAVFATFLTSTIASSAAEPDHFRQLDDVWPTPNDIRRPSGAPGKDYWQQKVDYDIRVEIDDERQILTGSETITYHNNSPDSLKYLWLQLDNNNMMPNADSVMAATAASSVQPSKMGRVGRGTP